MRYVSIGNSTVKSKQAYGVNRMDYDILKTFTVASEKITYLGNILVTPIEENVGGGVLSMSINMKDNHTNDYELFNKNYPKLSVLKKHNESIKTLQTLEY
ncbi:hypothetical protein CRYPA_1864 [uncultured Candidatus Thioglobus sp.]|nr:hypothetical protein CRYPA_1864 [uncultured Candidatus Thioglobus sp.]